MAIPPRAFNPSRSMCGWASNRPGIAVRPPAFQGFEADRGRCGTLKYRCPAAAFDFACAGSRACHRAGGVKPGAYGRILRIDLDSHDRRIFIPTP